MNSYATVPDLDDIIVFYKDGKFKVMKVADKIFVGKNILHVQVFKKTTSAPSTTAFIAMENKVIISSSDST